MARVAPTRPAQRGGQLAHHVEVLGLAHAAPAGDDHLRPGQVGHAALLGHALHHARPRRACRPAPPLLRSARRPRRASRASKQPGRTMTRPVCSPSLVKVLRTCSAPLKTGMRHLRLAVGPFQVRRRWPRRPGPACRPPARPSPCRSGVAGKSTSRGCVLARSARQSRPPPGRSASSWQRGSAQ